jgi:hypothetical protein
MAFHKGNKQILELFCIVHWGQFTFFEENDCPFDPLYLLVDGVVGEVEMVAEGVAQHGEPVLEELDQDGKFLLTIIKLFLENF